MNKAAVFLLVIMLSGCTHRLVANPPNDAAARWYMASNSLDAITNATDSEMRSLQSLHRSGAISDDLTYSMALQNLGKLSATSRAAKYTLVKIPASQFTPEKARNFSDLVKSMFEGTKQMKALNLPPDLASQTDKIDGSLEVLKRISG